MATLIVKIADSGAGYGDNGKSATGHMWISTEGISMGFAPVNEGDPYGLGTIHPNDDQMYKSTYYTGAITISTFQYEQLIAFAANPYTEGFSEYYKGGVNDCINFVWKALGIVGINTSGTIGDPWPIFNANDVDSALYTYLFGGLTDWQSDAATQGDYNVIYGSSSDDELYVKIDATTYAMTDAMYGGNGNDLLDGSVAQNDLSLFGNDDNDTLLGGAGNDTLEGGKGNDTYYSNNGDTIIDVGGVGQVFLADVKLEGGKKASGETVWKDADGHVYNLFGTTLLVASTDNEMTVFSNLIKIQNFKNHDLGINLDDMEDPKKDEDTAEKTKSPIVLDLNGDGISTTDKMSGAYFDHDSNGFAEQTGWINAQDGLLVRDLNNNDKIDNGGELFGSETLLANGQKAANGYLALAELDSNADKRIDSADAAYTTLKIWQDANGDGISTADELFSLADKGIQSISVDYTGVEQTDSNGNITKQISTFTKTDGSTGSSADIWFQMDKTYTIATESLPETAEIAALPDLGGHSTVYDLHQAMLRDSTGHLQNIVQN
jgi:hypothetical protein